jgi:hypothetical protein
VWHIHGVGRGIGSASATGCLHGAEVPQNGTALHLQLVSTLQCRLKSTVYSNIQNICARGIFSSLIAQLIFINNDFPLLLLLYLLVTCDCKNHNF